MFFGQEYQKYERQVNGLYDFGLDTGLLVNFIAFRPKTEVLLNVPSYRLNLSKSMKKVFDYLFGKRYLSRVKLLNSTIAKDCGVSVRTVIRATNTFMSDGLIFKTQLFARDVNEYMVSPLLKKGKSSFDVWLNTLSDRDLKLYRDHGLLPNGHFPKAKQYADGPEVNITVERTRAESIPTKPLSRFKTKFVTLNINNNNIDNLYINKNVMYARARNVALPLPDTESANTTNFVKIKKGEGVSVRNLDPNYESLEFTPAQKAVDALFSLRPTQKLKLFAFPESALEHCTAQFKKEHRKNDVKGWMWFIKQAIFFCGQIRIRPDWTRYYNLCTFYGIQSEKASDAPSSSAISKVASSAVKIEEKVALPTIEELAKEIVSWKQKIANFDMKHNFLGETLLELAKTRLKAVEQEFIERLALHGQS